MICYIPVWHHTIIIRHLWAASICSNLIKVQSSCSHSVHNHLVDIRMCRPFMTVFMHWTGFHITIPPAKYVLGNIFLTEARKTWGAFMRSPGAAEPCWEFNPLPALTPAFGVDAQLIQSDPSVKIFSSMAAVHSPYQSMHCSLEPSVGIRVQGNTWQTSFDGQAPIVPSCITLYALRASLLEPD